MHDVTSTYLDLDSSGVDTAVLPVGAVEQHGPHLPLSVDWFQGEIVARRVAERLDGFLLPGVPYGCSQAHTGFRGSISLAPETLGAVVTDIAESLLEQGFCRIAVLNFHGGNLVLKLAVRDLNLSQSLARSSSLVPVRTRAPSWVRYSMATPTSSTPASWRPPSCCMLHPSKWAHRASTTFQALAPCTSTTCP
ncbi:MAG: creatininase family protein [Chloroflexi bacterium]|nr:creatininase family protein [Chloroflexota bacterium]